MTTVFNFVLDTSTFGPASTQAIRALGNIQTTATRASGSIDGAQASIRRYAAALGSLIGGREIARQADAWSNLTAQLRLVTTNSFNLGAVQGRLLALANETRSSMGATVNLYARMARATEGLGFSQNTLITLTETINKSFLVSGATATEAANSVLQLGQAFASGTLRGDELRSVLENAPRLGRAIAEGLGTTIGGLRKMSQEGKLSSEKVAQAILKATLTIRAEFLKVPITIDGAMTQASNKFMVFIGTLNETTGASQAIIKFIRLLAQNFDVLTGAVVALGVAFTGLALKSLIASLVTAAVTLNPVVIGITAIAGVIGLVTYEMTRQALALGQYKQVVATFDKDQLAAELKKVVTEKEELERLKIRVAQQPKTGAEKRAAVRAFRETQPDRTVSMPLPEQFGEREQKRLEELYKQNAAIIVQGIQLVKMDEESKKLLLTTGLTTTELRRQAREEAQLVETAAELLVLKAQVNNDQLTEEIGLRAQAIAKIQEQLAGVKFLDDIQRATWATNLLALHDQGVMLQRQESLRITESARLDVAEKHAQASGNAADQAAVHEARLNASIAERLRTMKFISIEERKEYEHNLRSADAADQDAIRAQARFDFKNTELDLLEEEAQLAKDFGQVREIVDRKAKLAIEEAVRKTEGLDDAQKSVLANMLNQVLGFKQLNVEAETRLELERTIAAAQGQNMSGFGAEVNRNKQEIRDINAKIEAAGKAVGATDELARRELLRQEATRHTSAMIQLATEYTMEFADALADFGILGRDASKAIQGVGNALSVISDGLNKKNKLDVVLGSLNLIASLASTLFDNGKAAAKQAEELAKTVERLVEATKSLKNIANPLDGLSNALESVTDKYKRAIKEWIDGLKEQGVTLSANDIKFALESTASAFEHWAKRYGSFTFPAGNELLDIKIAYEQAIEAVKRQKESDLQAIVNENTARMMALQGMAGLAEEYRHQLELEKRIRDLKKEYGVLVTEEIEKQIRATDALEQYNAALDKAALMAATEGNISVREQRVKGNDQEADTIQASTDFNEKMRAAAKSYQAGEMTYEVFSRLGQLLQDELLKTLNDITASYAAQAAAAKKLQQDFRDDLAIREAVASATNDADNDAIEAMRQRLANEKEIYDAKERGISAVSIQDLIYVQGLEAEFRAKEKLRKADEERLALLKAQKEATEDLNVRMLSALGLTGAADEIALLNRQKRERQDAIDKKYGQDYLNELDRTQTAERKKQRDDNLKRQQEAFNQSTAAGAEPPTIESKPELNLAVGAADSTVNRLAAFAGSQLAVQNLMLTELRELVRLARLGAGEGMSVDEYLGNLSQATDRNSGLQPSNR